MTGPLDGVAVVVCRPERQAGKFKDLVRGLGGSAVAFPTLAIEPQEIDPGAIAGLAPDAFDWVVYTSANAVELSLERLGRPERSRVAAIGSGTARALAARGVEVHALPVSGADSEGLLALPAFAEPRGLRVLIVKGVGGRDALRNELTDRGAAVTVAEVYRRVVARPAHRALGELRSACDDSRTVIVVTSVEVLDALLALAPESEVPGLPERLLLVPGERVANAARRHGWRGPLLISPSAEDEAMLGTLQRHAGSAGPGGSA